MHRVGRWNSRLINDHGHTALAVAWCAAVHPHGIGAVDRYLENIACRWIAGVDAVVVLARL